MQCVTCVWPHAAAYYRRPASMAAHAARCGAAGARLCLCVAVGSSAVAHLAAWPVAGAQARCERRGTTALRHPSVHSWRARQVTCASHHSRPSVAHRSHAQVATPMLGMCSGVIEAPAAAVPPATTGDAPSRNAGAVDDSGLPERMPFDLPADFDGAWLWVQVAAVRTVARPLRRACRA